LGSFSVRRHDAGASCGGGWRAHVVPAIPSLQLAQGTERRAELAREELWLFPGGEVAAFAATRRQVRPRRSHAWGHEGWEARLPVAVETAAQSGVLTGEGLRRERKPLTTATHARKMIGQMNRV
jgi:hypothetical protein